MARAQEALGGIDVLVNNAGIVAATRIWDLPEDEFRRMVDVNLTGTYNVTRGPARPAGQRAQAGHRQPVPPPLRGGASGRLALRRVQGRGHRFTKALARELGPRGCAPTASRPASSRRT